MAARYNDKVRPLTDWQGRVTGYEARRVFPNMAAASHGQDFLDAINPSGFSVEYSVPFDPPEEPAWPSDATAREYPPNCDGNNTAGDVLAQAQYEAAVDGAECTSGVCLAVRGAND